MRKHYGHKPVRSSEIIKTKCKRREIFSFCEINHKPSRKNSQAHVKKMTLKI